MPIHIVKQHNSNTTIKVWKISESYDELMEGVQLKPKSLKRVLSMKSELHQRGFLSVRHLLKSFGYADEDLHYDENNKPYLEDGKHISISHSFTFSTVIISDEVVGVDIEKQREKIKVIAHKFMDYEMQYLHEEDVDYVKKSTIVWCAKESLYKLFATPGLSFKQHCLVIPFTVDEEYTTAWIDYKEKKTSYDIHYFEVENFMCAYALPI